MVTVLKVIVPVIILTLVIVGLSLAHRRVEKVRDLRKRVKLFSFKVTLTNKELGIYRDLVREVKTATSPSVIWGSEELLRERVQTLLAECERKLEEHKEHTAQQVRVNSEQEYYEQV